MNLQSIIKGWITSFLVYLLGRLNPEQKAKTDALDKAREVQAVKDKATTVEVAEIEKRVIGREEQMKANDAAAEVSRAETAAKLKQVDDAQTIEEVLAIK